MNTHAKLDPWSASSLLQKAIRRGDVRHALMAARAFFRFRGAMIWKRLLLIAFEDVGVGSPSLVADAARFCSDPAARADIGSDAEVLTLLVTRLAEAPKDRSTDYLICPAIQSPDYENDRCQIAGMRMADRIAVAADPAQPVMRRAVAAWYASGVNGGGPPVLSGGALSQLLEAFVPHGIPDDQLQMVDIAARLLKEPITVMLPLLMVLETEDAGTAWVDSAPVPDSPSAHGIPLYAFDKHTSIGKRAIAEFARTCDPVRDILAEHVPEFRARDVAAMAAFYVDAIPLAHRYQWSRSHVLEAEGRVADMMKVGTPRAGVDPIIRAVEENLDALNAIRARMLVQSQRHSAKGNS